MIIVTGATGFIGSAFVWQLNQMGREDIICVDTREPQAPFNYLEKLKYKEFLSADEIWHFLESSRDDIDWMAHIGACSSTTEMNRDYLWENNVVYSQKMWEWAIKKEAGLIYASSAATYGAGENGFSDRADSGKLQPLNPYGESKVLFDRWVLEQTTTPKHWYGLKYFNVFGPNEAHKGFQASVPFKAFSEINETQQLKLFRSHREDYSDGEQKRDFVYVKDITRWMAELMEKKPQSDIYNMGFGTARSWLDLGMACFESLGIESKVEWVDIPESIRDNYQYFTEADMSHFFAQGMSAPEWPLEKAIEDYYTNYMKKEPGFL